MATYRTHPRLRLYETKPGKKMCIVTSNCNSIGQLKELVIEAFKAQNVEFSESKKGAKYLTFIKIEDESKKLLNNNGDSLMVYSLNYGETAKVILSYLHSNYKEFYDGYYHSDEMNMYATDKEGNSWKLPADLSKWGKLINKEQDEQ